jgi:signal transduction histidine kinase
LKTSGDLDMNKKIGRWFFLVCVVIIASIVIIKLSYLNINTRIAYAKNGSLSLVSDSTADGFALLDGQLLVSNGLYTPEDVQDGNWYLSRDLRSDTQMGNLTYRFSLTVADGSDLCFLALQPSNIRIWINGIELPEKQLESNHVYHFSEFNSTGDNAYSILIQVGEFTSRRDRYHGLMFGSQEQLILVLMAWVSSGMVAVGICVVLLIQSLALYLQKRSERYLLILALIVLQAGLRGIAISVFPLLSIFWPGAELSDLARALFRITPPLNLLLLAYIFPKDVGRKLVMAGILVSVCGVICTIAGLWGISTIALMATYVDLSLLFLETFCILKSFIHDQYGSRVLLVGVSGYIIGRVFSELISYGIIPAGIVDTYFYPWQYANLIYLISYVIAIDGIFTRKFSEADDLSAKLQLVNTNLEHIIAERTHKLEETNHKLSESNEALIQFQKAKQVFLGNVVHNLRTPLFTLGVSIDMLQEDYVDYPQSASHLKNIKEKIDFIQRMISDLFFVVRIDDGRVSYDLKQQDLNPLLAQVCLDYQPKAERKGLVLQPVLPEYPTQVAYDGLYFRQAIENILDNAIRHSTIGRPILVRMNQSENMAQILITNYGEPILSEDLPHIFERYYRGKDSKPEQTGLGLAIAQEIVLKHDGTISVKSDQEGTSFTICLPIILIS